jgi:hypothetical protein
MNIKVIPSDTRDDGRQAWITAEAHGDAMAATAPPPITQVKKGVS